MRDPQPWAVRHLRSDIMDFIGGSITTHELAACVRIALERRVPLTEIRGLLGDCDYDWDVRADDLCRLADA